MIHQDESVSTHLSHSGSPVCFLPQSYTISGHWMTYGWLNYSQEKYYRYDSVRWNYKPVGEIKKSSHNLWNNHSNCSVEKIQCLPNLFFKIFFMNNFKPFLYIFGFKQRLQAHGQCRQMNPYVGVTSEESFLNKNHALCWVRLMKTGLVRFTLDLQNNS